MTTPAVARRPAYTAEERSVAKTLALSLGVERAHDALNELWGSDPDRSVPAKNTLTTWRDDKGIPVDRDLAAAYEAGITVIVSTSAERVMLAAERALLEALEHKNLDQRGYVESLSKVWRAATDRLMAAPVAPREPTGLAALMPPPSALPPGATYRATYAVSAPIVPQGSAGAITARDVESQVVNAQ